MCVSKLTIFGSDNGLLRGRRQAIIGNNGGILLIGPLGTNFSEIWMEIQIFSLKKMCLKMSYAKCFPFRLGLNVLLSWLQWYIEFLKSRGILLIGPLGTNFSEIWMEIQIFSLKKMCLKMSSAKCVPFRLGLNVLLSWLQLYIEFLKPTAGCIDIKTALYLDKPSYSWNHKPAFTVFIHYCNSNEYKQSFDKQLKHSLWVSVLTLSMFTGMLFHTTSCPNHVIRPCTYSCSLANMFICI